MGDPVSGGAFGGRGDGLPAPEGEAAQKPGAPGVFFPVGIQDALPGGKQPVGDIRPLRHRNLQYSGFLRRFLPGQPGPIGALPEFQPQVSHLTDGDSGQTEFPRQAQGLRPLGAGEGIQVLALVQQAHPCRQAGFLLLPEKSIRRCPRRVVQRRTDLLPQEGVPGNQHHPFPCPGPFHRRRHCPGAATQHGKVGHI